MKRIILSLLMSVALFGQAWSISKYTAIGFAASVLMQGASVSVSYASALDMANPYKLLIQDTYKVSSTLLFGGSLLGYALGIHKAPQPDAVKNNFRKISYGAAAGSIVGFVGILAAWYYQKI